MFSNSSTINGFVVDNQDPKKLGRVRVSFYLPDNKQVKTEWARLALPYASKQGGMHFIPNQGDEVVLTFLSGDSNQPVILGCLYNQEHTPPDYPYDNKLNGDGKNSLRSIKTANGLEISLNDKEDDTAVRIFDGENFDLQLKRTEKKAHFKDQAGNCVEIDSEGKSVEVTDQAGNRLFIKDGQIEIHASQRITFGAGGSHAVPLGDLLMQLFNSHTHTAPNGPTSPPIQPMQPSHLSKLSFTK